MKDVDAVHVLQTRFSVRYDAARQMPARTWYEKRLRLFEDITLRSIRAQSVLPDRWMILCDPDTPRPVLEDLNAMTAGVEAIEIVSVGPPFSADAASAIIEQRFGKLDKVLTTRLDSDDAVARDFCERLQLAASDRDEGCFLNFTSGAQFDADRGRVYLTRDRGNPFISRLEVGQELSTVWVDQHGNLSQHGRVVQIRSAHPMWLQCVHGDNLGNEIRGALSTGRRVVPFFEMDFPTVEEGSLPGRLASGALARGREVNQLIRGRMRDRAGRQKT